MFSWKNKNGFTKIKTRSYGTWVSSANQTDEVLSFCPDFIDENYNPLF